MNKKPGKTMALAITAGVTITFLIKKKKKKEEKRLLQLAFPLPTKHSFLKTIKAQQTFHIIINSLPSPLLP